jgi:secreted trypsin-like serine protease
VVSWDCGCARENLPGVYSRVSGVKDWIDSRVCDLFSNPPTSCGPSNAGGAEINGDNQIVIEVKYDDFPLERLGTAR